MDLPHIQGCIFLQTLLQLSLTISLQFTNIWAQANFCQRSSHWDVALVPVCVCGNGTFLEIKFRAWAYLTSMLLVLAASSLRMEYMSEIASRPDRWRSSEYNEYFDICISRSASSTSLWATVSENLSLAKACNKQATSCSDEISYMLVLLEKERITQFEIFTYNWNAEYAEECSDSCVGGWCIWLRFLLADAGICSCDVFLKLSRNRRDDSSRSRYVGSDQIKIVKL